MQRKLYSKKIIHGLLSSSIFSKIFGTIFPGEGSIYLEKSLVFKKPMYVDKKYNVGLIISILDKEKHVITLKTQIYDQLNNLTLDGKAKILNKEIIK